MNSMNEIILTLVIFSPLIGVLLIVLLKPERTTAIKTIGLGVSILTFILSLHLYFRFDSATAAMQFVKRVPWISSLNISYSVGIDGISLLLVLLTTFLTPLVLLASWDSITQKIKQYVIFMLLLEVGMLGVFCAIDMFLFYVFWEAMLIPMYFIIGVWGGQERIYAAVKFFIYTMFGSVLMLVAILWLGYTAANSTLSHFTTDYIELLNVAPNIPIGIQTWMLLAFALSFAIKVPAVPVSYMAAGCACPGSNRRERHPCRRTIEDGDLWASSLLYTVFPDCVGSSCAIYKHSGNNRNNLRRSCLDGPNRYQETRRIFIGKPSRICRARHFRDDRSESTGEHHSDG